VTALLALFVALGGTTYAATGGTFILGQPNTATSPTGLTSTNAGNALNITQQSTAAGTTALGLNVPAYHAPFTVNSGIKVTNLNADKLDGKDSTAFLQSCPSPLTARYGRICVGSDGGSRTWRGALDYCAGYGLRLPSTSEAYTLAINYVTPGVPTDSGFWTNDAWHDIYDAGSIDVANAVSENGDLASVYENLRSYSGNKTVCVTDPSNI
jgi:hypothetical protein